jgi:hypothetical protein
VASKLFETDSLVSLRRGDLPVIRSQRPGKAPGVYGVMIATIKPLPEPIAPREPRVESAAIVGCVWNERLGGWQWAYFAPALKELIGDVLFDNHFEPDVWHELTFMRETDRAA